MESELQDWFDYALGRVHFSNSSVPGLRRGPRVFQLDGGTDGSALLPEDPLHPSIEQMLEAGELTMHVLPLDPRRYMLALLKHAYLAACLLLEHIPDTPDAAEIRADLVAARDATSRHMSPTSRRAEQLIVYRSQQPPAGPSLALVRSRPNSPSIPQETLISLAGTLFVSWPFDKSPGEFAAERAARNYRLIPVSRPVAKHVDSR